jgi:Ribbon-helix-helix protein, copG family
MSTYGIKKSTASLHLRLPKSLLAELKVLCAKEDGGGMSAFVRRAFRAYILMAQGSQQQIKSAAPEQTVTEYGAATTLPSNKPTLSNDEPYIPDFIKNAPGLIAKLI